MRASGKFCTKTFDRRAVLDDVSLTVFSGEIIGLVGTNGSGKTMLMRCICGFVIPGASGGIGIREAILSVLLDGLASESVIMFIIVAHRLITIIGDFTVYSIVVLVSSFYPKKKKS